MGTTDFDGRVYVHSDQAATGTAGSGAGQSDDDYAPGIFSHVFLLPGRLGALLDDAEHSDDHSAVVHQQNNWCPHRGKTR